jgi:hypothetical protein
MTHPRLAAPGPFLLQVRPRLRALSAAFGMVPWTLPALLGL